MSKSRIYGNIEMGKIFWEGDRSEYYVSVVSKDTGDEVDRIYGGTYRGCQDIIANARCYIAPLWCRHFDE
jgi:hypothetical protein